jgi:hypothetical protein
MTISRPLRWFEAFSVVMAHEWRLLRADGTARAVIAVLAIFLGVALFNGQRIITQRETALQGCWLRKPSGYPPCQIDLMR